MVLLPRGECHHPAWAKEMTPAGIVVCRICNPKNNGVEIGP